MDSSYCVNEQLNCYFLMTNAHQSCVPKQTCSAAAEAEEHPACRGSHLGTNKSHIFHLNIDFHLKLNISGHQCCFLCMTELVPYPQMMDCVCATALPMDSSSSAREMRNNNHPTTSYSQVFVYLKGKCPSSDGGWERKGRKS